MNNVKRLAEMGCGAEILNSGIERGNLQAAIANCNTFSKYLRKCIKYFKEDGQEEWILGGINSLTPYYNRLLEIENLAEKYKFLFGEKYYKCKLATEKLLDEAQNYLK